MHLPRLWTGLAAAIALLSGGSTASALTTASPKGEGPTGLVWIFFAVFVLGALGLAFMNTKRNEAE